MGSDTDTSFRLLLVAEFCSHCGSKERSCLSTLDELDEVEEPEEEGVDVIEDEYSSCLIGSSAVDESSFWWIFGHLISDLGDNVDEVKEEEPSGMFCS